MGTQIYADKDKSKIIFTKVETTCGEVLQTYSYDFADGQFYSHNYKHVIKKVKSINRFFAHEKNRNITWRIEGYGGYDGFIHLIDSLENRCRNIGTFLARMRKHLHYEPYFLLQYNTSEIKGCEKPPSFYTKDIQKLFIQHRVAVNYDIERYFIKYYDLMTNTVREIFKEYEITGDERIFSWFKEILESNTDNFFVLVNEYNYDSLRLMKYLIYLEDYENYKFPHSLNDFADYVNMQSEMSNKFNKYPRNLKTAHDVTVGNYNNFTKYFEEEKFRNAVDYNLEWIDKDYVVFAPILTDDVKKEGGEMHHCVASYIPHIINGERQVLFMREIDNWEKCYVTIEIRNNVLVEARQKHNDPLNQEQRKILKKYCKDKKITYHLVGD